MKRDAMSVMSASHHSTMSPLDTCSERQSASPLPPPPAISGRTLAAVTTWAPASAAAMAVSSVEWSSMTMISSTRPSESTRKRRRRWTTQPTVAISLWAGMQTETTWSPLASTSARRGTSR